VRSKCEMGITQRDIKILWGLSGNCCAFPGCSKELITTESVVSVLAEMAHIIAQKPDGPRGESTLSRKERDCFRNLILLCPYHHTLIDKDSSTWTADKLLEMKLNHETRMCTQRLKGSAYGPRFTTIHYLNIPRILMDIAANGNLVSWEGIDLDIDEVHNLRGLGMIQLAAILTAFKEFIQKWSQQSEYGINALDIASCQNMTELDTGVRVHFDQPMRTKNGRKLVNKTFVTHGNIQTDPHIYCSVDQRRVCFFIDPRWVTTSTAFSVFLQGELHVLQG
jgi:HNH endonuclease